jgi:hypothetical protein
MGELHIGPVIVEAAETWPALVAAILAAATGVVAAFIVAWATLRSAKKQREADKTRFIEQRDIDAARFGKQLAHDRDVRKKQDDAAAERLDAQLAQDREMRDKQDGEASNRLAAELAHDRKMRDLQYLRETLAPIVGDALDWDAFTSLHKGLAATGSKPYDEWKDVISPLVDRVKELDERLRRLARSLLVLLGGNAAVALRLRDIGNHGDTLVKLVRKRVEAGQITPSIKTELDDLLLEYGQSHAAFIEAANEAVNAADD